MSVPLASRELLPQVLSQANSFRTFTAVFADARCGDDPDELVAALELLASGVPGGELAVRLAFRWHVVLGKGTVTSHEQWWSRVSEQQRSVCVAVAADVTVDSDSFSKFEIAANKSAQFLPNRRFFTIGRDLLPIVPDM